MTPFTIPKPQSDRLRPLPTADMHAARVCQLIDLGTHTEEYQGEKKTRRKVRIGFELAERATFREGEPEEPFVVSKELTLSLDKKATFRKYVEAIRGAFKDEAEAGSFDATTLIGMPVLVGVEHKEKQDKTGTYAKVSNVAKLPKSMTAPELFNEPLIYHTSMGGEGTYGKLPDFLKEVVCKSPEFANAH
jgi:hypothetical protein